MVAMARATASSAVFSTFPPQDQPSGWARGTHTGTRSGSSPAHHRFAACSCGIHEGERREGPRYFDLITPGADSKHDSTDRATREAVFPGFASRYKEIVECHYPFLSPSTVDICRVEHFAVR